MANFIPAIASYATSEGIDKIFTRDSIIKKWFVTPKTGLRFDFNQKGAVLIMDILTDGLSDYYKANHDGQANSLPYANDNQNNGEGSRDGLKRGNVNARWTTYTLTHLRGRQLPVDWIDDEEAANLIVGNTLSQFVSAAYVPEFDEVGFSTLASKTYATFGNRVVEDIAANSIISRFNAALEYMHQLSVPEEKIAFFVSPSVLTLIKSTTELQHFVTPTDFISPNGVSFRLEAYEGHPIIDVPSDRFFTDPMVSEGCYSSASSKQINFICCSLDAMIPVVKVEWAQVFGNDNGVTNFKGWLIDFLSYYDFIVPRNRVPAVYASVSSTGAASAYNGLLRVGMVAGTATGSTILAVAMSSPAGRTGQVVYGKTAFTLGASVTIDGTSVAAVPTEATGNWAQYTPVAGAIDSGKCYFALVSGGKAVAVSAQITIPLGA